jgi:hypothetical protein
MIHGFARRFVVVKQITGQKHHIDISLSCYGHDFVEGVPGIVTSGWIAFSVSDMVIS